MPKIVLHNIWRRSNIFLMAIPSTHKVTTHLQFHLTTSVPCHMKVWYDKATPKLKLQTTLISDVLSACVLDDQYLCWAYFKYMYSVAPPLLNNYWQK